MSNVERTQVSENVKRRLLINDNDDTHDEKSKEWENNIVRIKKELESEWLNLYTNHQIYQDKL